MHTRLLALYLLFFSGWTAAAAEPTSPSLVVASFNVSMEATNYTQESASGTAIKGPQILMQHLASGTHPQIRNIAEIIQRTQPDIILLNEFDYIENPKHGIRAFIDNYLKTPQQGAAPQDYPYFFYAPSNTGLPTTFDLDNNGKHDLFGADAQGFGLYAGHYGMVLLSKYPIQTQQVRTFQRFLWSDMPGALAPLDAKTGQPFYSILEWDNLRLSSKSHWDIPVEVHGSVIRVLASHPTPPVFDGAEDRNGRRNHDEIRFWLDYITPGKSDYIYDDRGVFGGLAEDAHFVILGDQNASPDRSNDTPSVISQLLASFRVNTSLTPESKAGQQNRPDNPYGKHHTAGWGARADYVIPSQRLQVQESGVFWPSEGDPLHRLVKDRASSSDHRLVWVKLSIPSSPGE